MFKHIGRIGKVIVDEGLEIQPDRSEIKHKVKPIDPNNPDSEQAEDIDQVFEPLAQGEKKKLKSRSITNPHRV